MNFKEHFVYSNAIFTVSLGGKRDGDAFHRCQKLHFEVSKLIIFNARADSVIRDAGAVNACTFIFVLAFIRLSTVICK